MNQIWKRNLLWTLVLALVALASPVSAKDKSEDELIADLASSTETKVTDALLQLEKHYPTSTKAFPTMKKLLTDPRVKVRRKAARVLGVLHAEVSQEDIKKVCALLKGSDPQEVLDGLKSLRGLKAPDAVAEILPLLKSATPNVIRDACRTLAVLGSKDTIPALEPLLKHPQANVQKDAQDAIFALRAKS